MSGTLSSTAVAESTKRSRAIARRGLTLMALGATAVLAWLASGMDGALVLGPIRISIRTFERPFLCGFVALVWLLIQEWHVPRWRRFAIGLLGALAVLAIVNFARETPPIVTDGDMAVIELYTELATRGELLVGPYSRFGWHHPGPLYFYVQAPLYALGDHKAASIYAGAVAMNLLALMVLAWTIGREDEGPLLVLVTGACVLFTWRAPRFLASPWTAHVPILAGLTFLVLVTAVISGRRRVLPLALVFGSFVVQTHLGFVPIVGALCAVMLITLAVSGLRGDHSLRRVLNASAWICLALWLLPISEALSHAGGNVTALWRFFAIDGAPHHTLSEAIINGSYGLVGVLRPDFGLPWGGHFEPAHSTWTIAGTVGQFLLLAAIARREFTAGRRFAACLALSSLAASIISVLALTRIRGTILDHEIFWLSALGAMNLGIIGAAGLRSLHDRQLVRWTPGGRVAAASGVVVLLCGFLNGVYALHDLTSFELRRRERAAILATHESIRRYVRDQGVQRALIRIDGDKWSDAAGVLLRLRQEGIAVAVSDESRFMFTDEFAATGHEDALITISPPRQRDPKSPAEALTLVDTSSLFVDAVRLPSALPVR